MTQFIPRPPDPKVNVSHTHPLAEAFYLLVGAALFSGTTVLVLIFFADISVRFIPVQVEGRLLESFLDQWPPTQDEKTKALMHQVNQLSTHWPENPYSLRVHILADDEANAFALPGGMILITQGMLTLARTEQELAFVLAHELGHFYHRDHLRGMSRGVLLQLLLLATGLSHSTPVVHGTAQLALLYHSRGQELAADQFALELLFEEYGTIQGALEFFAHLKQTEKQNSTPEFLRSHPLSTHRLQAISTRAAETLRN